MEKIRLKNGDELSRVVVGCMRLLGAGMDAAGVNRFVHECMEMGIDTFDHAPVYGAGGCESFFGEAVLAAEPALRQQMKIVTKAGIKPPGKCGNTHAWYDSRKDEILKEMDLSLGRLHTDHVDLLLIHRPDYYGDPEQVAAALEEILRQGKALHVGVSNYTPSMFDALQHFLKAPLEANQMEFSAKTTENFFNGVSDQSFITGAKLMAWSPLGGGSIFKGEDEQSLRIRAEVEKIAAVRGTSMETVLYAWLLSHPVNMMVVTGSMKTDRIRSAVEALDLKLDYDEWYGILAASRGYEVP